MTDEPRRLKIIELSKKGLSVEYIDRYLDCGLHYAKGVIERYKRKERKDEKAKIGRSK
jgi:hypothetical protein